MGIETEGHKPACLCGHPYLDHVEDGTLDECLDSDCACGKYLPDPHRSVREFLDRVKEIAEHPPGRLRKEFRDE